MSSHRLHPDTSIWLDAIRGLAAHAVVIGHSYMVFFAGATHLPENMLLRISHVLVAGVSSVPHQAVMAFFVMSGYLVGGRVLHDMLRDSFRFQHYFRDRLIRLWLVLLPALLLTATLDWASFTYGVGDHILASPRFPDWWPETNPWGWTTFLSNAAFLQMIATYQFGSNTALWSISNEFWYYMLFPCIVSAIFLRGMRQVLAMLGALLVMAMFATSFKLHDPDRPAIFFVYFAIWVAGALAPLIRDTWRAPLGCAGIAYAAIWFSYYGFPVSFWGDGAVAALLLGFILLSHKVPAQLISGPSRFFAGYSYSLYAIHFPILICLICFDPVLYDKVVFSFHNLARFAAYLALVNFVAIGFWYLTERNTSKVRRYFSGRANRPTEQGNNLYKT